MRKFKTLTQFAVPNGRVVEMAVVRMIIDKIEIDANNVVSKGYYYYYDANGAVVQLAIIDNLKEIALIEIIENNLLEDFTNQRNVIAAIFQRFDEFSFMQLQSEAGENYGTVRSDWVTDED